jgi:hypothetical protein
MRIAGAGKALTVAAVFVAAGFGFGLGLALRDEFASTSVEAEPASAAEFLRSAPSPSAAPVAVPRPASSRRDAIVEVAQRTTPAVVTIGLTVVEGRDHVRRPAAAQSAAPARG